ncbi:MAG TPA: FAD-binding protein, partial [Sorangium sp.]|nr:FAD-binding protein [Sorangium sp.]
MLVRAPFPRISANLAERACIRLERALGPSKVLTAPSRCAAYASDESEQEAAPPDAVVLAACAQDIATTLEVANALGVPVTPRGAGTGKSGGGVPVCGGIALCTLGMNSIVEIDRDEFIAVVEPGVILGDLYAAVEAEGLFYPPDPNSWALCALGGNIAENAAGPRAFKYGVTRDYVLGLDVISAAGSRLQLGRRTAKGVTGYDLTALMVGSEGTLALTVGATLRLRRKPQQVATLLGLFATVAGAARAVSAIVAAGLVPRCLELIDRAALQAMRRQGVALDGRAGALLLMEVDGDVAACERQLEEVGARAVDAGALEVLVAQDAAQRERLWAARRQLSHVTAKLARYKISEDVVVPRTRMADLVDEVMRIGERNEVHMLNYGHAGDGNLHVNLLWDEPADAAR